MSNYPVHDTVWGNDAEFEESAHPREEHGRFTGRGSGNHAEDHPLVKKAARFAEHAHGPQKRKYTDEPYTNHTKRVAMLVHEAGGDPATIVAAHLHDTIEDTKTTRADIEREFGPEVAALVDELTDKFTPQAHPDKNRRTRKKLEAERLGKISDKAKMVKRADVEDNTADILKHDPKFGKVYAEEMDYLKQQLGAKYPTGLVGLVPEPATGGSLEDRIMEAARRRTVRSDPNEAKGFGVEVGELRRALQKLRKKGHITISEKAQKNYFGSGSAGYRINRP
jgi:hypothetical protein